MKLTRSQRIVLIVLGALTVLVYGCLVSIVVRNSRQTSPVDSPTTQAEEPTPGPTPTTSPTPAPTPTPVAPQTRYDLQVARERENATLRVQRGTAYVALEAYAYALQDFDAAIEIDPGLPQAHLGRGQAHFHLKEWSAALEDFAQAAALNPDLAEAHAWRGHVLAEWEDYGPAVEALERAVSLDDTDPIKHLWLAEALLCGGNPGEARIEYTAALALDERLAAAYVGRALAYAQQWDFAAAQADLDSALAVAPHDPVALNGQARFYAWYRHDHLDEAERLAQRAIAGAEGDFEKARYLHTLGWTYFQQRRYEEAAATLEQAAALATVEGQVAYREILEHLEQTQAPR
jgi:tetratricopeptide (TPR) repeat protein